MTHTIKNFDEAYDEIRNDAIGYNKHFLYIWKDGIIMIKNKGERLTTLGFGIPNLLKLGEVGYFPEQFIVDFGLQGKTASDIQRYFISTDMAFDGDVMCRIYDKITYFVDLKHNVFIKYDDVNGFM